MEMNSILIGTGIALFIALLAWGDQIRKPRDSLHELEKNYLEQLKRRGKKKSKILPLIRSSSEYTFRQQMSSLLEVWDDKTEDTDLTLRDSIQSLHDQKKSIENHYNFRYYTVIGLTLISFIFAVVSDYWGSISTHIWQITIDHLLIGTFFIIILIIIGNLISCNCKEQKFIQDLYSAFDKVDS